MTHRTGSRAALMRINIWIVLAVLLALLAITRLSQYKHETQRDYFNKCVANRGNMDDDAPKQAK